jgi:hypothetical protein
MSQDLWCRLNERGGEFVSPRLALNRPWILQNEQEITEAFATNRDV